MTKTLHDYNKSVAWWGAGLFLTAIMMLSVYPSIRESSRELTDYVENMPEAFKAMFGMQGMDYASPAGYLNTELFSIVIPAVFAAFAIGAGSRAVAGEEDRKTLDLLLSTPIRRRSVLLQKAAAALADTAVLVVIFWVSMCVAGAIFDFGMGPGRLFEGTLNAGVLGLVFGSVALLWGAWRGGRGAAIGIASAVLVATFLLSSLAQIVDWLEPWRFLSPFYWYGRGNALVSGVDYGDLMVMVATSLVLLALSVVAFDRRDLRA